MQYLPKLLLQAFFSLFGGNSGPKKTQVLTETQPIFRKTQPNFSKTQISGIFKEKNPQQNFLSVQLRFSALFKSMKLRSRDKKLSYFKPKTQVKTEKNSGQKLKNSGFRDFPRVQRQKKCEKKACTSILRLLEIKK